MIQKMKELKSLKGDQFAAEGMKLFTFFASHKSFQFVDELENEMAKQIGAMVIDNAREAEYSHKQSQTLLKESCERAVREQDKEIGCLTNTWIGCAAEDMKKAQDAAIKSNAHITAYLKLLRALVQSF